jgi:5'-3' exonuclease
MDCNSIIYDAVRLVDGMVGLDNDAIEEQITILVIKTIDDYIRTVSPDNTVFIAFDGNAPLAKMVQQRNRRFNSLFNKKVSILLGEKVGWDTNVITPGTEFMDKLSIRIHEAFNNKESKYKIRKMVVSTSTDDGEGEHKLMKFIRDSDFINDTVAIYGLDSDLIMLSIFHLRYCKNIYVFREAPEFIKSHIPVEVRNEDSNLYFLDISLLSKYIVKEMDLQCPDMHRIYDYVFLCFFLGNDFLPSFAGLNIRTHGLDVLLETYRKVLGRREGKYLISKEGGIDWREVNQLMQCISRRERELIIREEDLREKRVKRLKKENLMKVKDILEEMPLRYRGEEKYINAREEGWEKRFAKIGKGEKNYKEMVEWVYDYYRGKEGLEEKKYEGSSVIILKGIDWLGKKEYKRKEESPEIMPTKEDYERIEEMEVEWKYKNYLWERKML